jgi:hypothetical protein
MTTAAASNVPAAHNSETSSTATTCLDLTNATQQTTATVNILPVFQEQ